MNIVMDGDRASVEDMIRSTERGLLVTRFWYIREVDPYKKILTGMTRDGTFWIEDGQVRHGRQEPALQPEPDGHAGPGGNDEPAATHRRRRVV